MEDIGSVVLFHRKQAGLSRAELCALAGIGRTALFDIEHGKATVRLQTLLRVLLILNIRLQWTSPLKEIYETSASSR